MNTLCDLIFLVLVYTHSCKVHWVTSLAPSEHWKWTSLLASRCRRLTKSGWDSYGKDMAKSGDMVSKAWEGKNMWGRWIKMVGMIWARCEMLSCHAYTAYRRSSAMLATFNAWGDDKCGGISRPSSSLTVLLPVVVREALGCIRCGKIAEEIIHIIHIYIFLYIYI